MKPRLKLLFASAAIVLVVVLVLVSARSTAGQSPPPPGSKPEARIQVGRQLHRLTPDQVGAFPRVAVQKNTATGVQVFFPSAPVGQAAAIYVLDGGTLDNGKARKQTQLDRNGSASFSFHSKAASAQRRVAIRTGGDLKVVRFEVTN